MKKYDAVIAGYICVDLIPDFNKHEQPDSTSKLLMPGKLIEIEGLNPTLGGVVANTGIAMKKFSKNVYLNGLIGDDFIGKLAFELLDRCNLLTGVKIVKDEGTAFGLVIAPPGVDRIFLESPGCSRIFDIRDINFEIIAQSRLFHFGYPPLLKQFYLDDGKQLVDMFTRIQDMGVITSLDFSLPDPDSESGKINWPLLLQNVLPAIDIFVPSLEEALQILMPDEYVRLQAIAVNSEIIDLVPMGTIRELGDLIISSGVKIALIKAGHRGAFLWTGDISTINERAGLNLEDSWNNIELWSEAHPLDVEKIKNASGAGDTASAAFLSAILDGEGPHASLTFAAIAGRNNLYCYNIYDELSNWAEMVEEIKLQPDKITNLKLLKGNDHSTVY